MTIMLSMGELKRVSEESKMCRNKISMIPMIIIIVCLGQFDTFVVRGVQPGRVEKTNPAFCSECRLVRSFTLPSPAQPPVSESAPHNKIDPSEKRGTVQPPFP